MVHFLSYLEISYQPNSISVLLEKKEGCPEVVRLCPQKKEHCPEAMRLCPQKKEHCPEIVGLLLEKKKGCHQAVSRLLEKKRAKRCVFDGQFGDRGMRFCLGGGTQKKGGTDLSQVRPAGVKCYKSGYKKRVLKSTLRGYGLAADALRCEALPARILLQLLVQIHLIRGDRVPVMFLVVGAGLALRTVDVVA